ncbi:hypothetical protein TNIN_129481, partial [Trichonephila inaurata madagascariensis]
VVGKLRKILLQVSRNRRIKTTAEITYEVNQHKENQRGRKIPSCLQGKIKLLEKKGCWLILPLKRTAPYNTALIRVTARNRRIKKPAECIN